MQYNRTLRERMEELLRNTTKEQEEVSITIHDTNVRGNDLSIAINDLLYMETQKNNVSVCFLKEGNVVAVDIHTTLTHALEELKEFENIFQCHRSFAVNVNNITSARGNSNGYQLTLGNCTNIIPVSRRFVPKLKTYLT
jgi:lytTr DNA-binding domain protein